MPIQKNKNFIFITLLIIFSNLFFGNAFQNLGISGYPINELFIIFLLINLGFLNNLNQIIKNFNLEIYFFWILLGCFYILYCFFQNGIWAIRDGLFIIDTLFIIIGYATFNSIKEINILKKFFSLIVKFSILYVFIFFFRENLEFISPKIKTYSGNVHSLFFNFFSIKFTMLWSAFIAYIIYNDKNNFIKNFVLFFLLIFSFILFQSRLIYLSAIAGFLYLYFIKKINIKSFIHGTLIFLIIIFLFSIMDIQIKGRLEVFEFKFFYQHFLTLLSPFMEINVDYVKLEGQLGSANDRMSWWNSIYLKSTENIKTFLIGSGFGMPLINFYASSFDIPAREPHNSYITFIGRIGYLGLIIWTLLHLKIFNIFKILYKKLDINIELKEISIIISLYLIIIIISSLGDSMFQFPCFSIPFYFFSGVLLKINYLINQSHP